MNFQAAHAAEVLRVVGDDGQAVIKSGRGNQGVGKSDAKTGASQLTENLCGRIPNPFVNGEDGKGSEVFLGLRIGIEARRKLRHGNARDVRRCRRMAQKKRKGSVPWDALVLPGKGNQKIGVV